MPHSIDRPGISPETLEDNLITHLGESEAQERFGIPHAGIQIPYLDLEGKRIMDGDGPFARLRLDSVQGKMKYYSPEGSGAHVYIPHATRSLCDPEAGLVIVEGEFKAMSLSEEGIAAVGLCGLYATAKAEGGEHRLLPDLIDVLAAKSPRKIYLLGDADTAFNWQFADAAVRLAQQVGAPVLLPRIPLDAPSDIDECREEMGRRFGGFWDGLCDEAVEVDPDAEANDVALELLRRAIPQMSEFEGAERTSTINRVLRVTVRFDELGRSEVGDLLKTHTGLKLGVFRDMLEHIEQKEARSAGRQQELGDPEIVAVEGEPLIYGGSSFAVNQPYFASCYKKRHDPIYSPEEHRFYEYDSDTGLWLHVTFDSVKSAFSDMLGKASREWEEPKLAAKRSDTTHRSLAEQLKGKAEVRNAFKGRGDIVHVANGMLEIRDGPPELKPFAKSYRSRNRSPISFDADAGCPRFVGELLAPVMEHDDIDLFQRYCGSLLLGGNEAQRIMLLTGAANSGKSQLVSLVEEVVGRHNIGELRTDRLDDRFGLAAFIGKTMAFGRDVPPDFLNTKGAAFLKKMTGGDTIHAEQKFQNDWVELRGNYSVLVAANTALHVKLAGDHGAWSRRLIEIPFGERSGGKRITNFGRKLVEEEGPGILNWFVEGAIRHRRELDDRGDFALTDRQTERITELLNESDSLRQFVAEEIVPYGGKSLTKDEICIGYRKFCIEHGWTPQAEHQAKKALGGLMSEIHGRPVSKSVSRGAGAKRGYRGVCLRSDVRTYEVDEILDQ